MSNPIGNVKGFTMDMVKNILYVLGLGYMGGSIASMSKSGNELFPYDLSQPPYKGPLSTGDEEGLLEYLWPMKSVGFPYATMNQLGESNGSQYLKWLLETCAYSFAAFRYACSTSAKSGERISKAWGGDLFRFYVMPYIFIHIMPAVPILMLVVTFFSSLFAANRYGMMYVMSPLTGWGYGLSLCGKSITFGCLMNMVMLGIAGLMLPIIHVPWWFVVTLALTLYSYVILLLSPFLWTNGLSKTFQEINQFKRSLVILFMYFTLKSAHQFLTTQVSSGLLIGALYVLYLLFSGKMC